MSGILFFISASCHPLKALVNFTNGHDGGLIKGYYRIGFGMRVKCKKCYALGQLKFIAMNNKAFRNLFCNSQKTLHTSPTRIIEAVKHSSNSTTAFTKYCTASRNFFFFFFFFFFVNAIVEFEECLTASIIRVGRFRGGVKTLLFI